MVKSAYADYLGALSKEQNLQKLLDELKGQVYKTNSNVVLYNSLKIETDNITQNKGGQYYDII